MYSELQGLRADTHAALSLRREQEVGLNRFEDYVGSSLHFYARFMLEKEAFVHEFGGIWFFGQADVEQAVSDAIKLIEHFSPLSYRQESQARLRASQDLELDAFLTGLARDDAGRRLLDRWQERLLECRCDLDEPRPHECKVHAMMRACAFFEDVLDADWYRMVPWHGEPPPNLTVVDVATLYRDVGLGTS